MQMTRRTRHGLASGDEVGLHRVEVLRVPDQIVRERELPQRRVARERGPVSSVQYRFLFLVSDSYLSRFQSDSDDRWCFKIPQDTSESFKLLTVLARNPSHPLSEFNGIQRWRGHEFSALFIVHVRPLEPELLERAAGLREVLACRIIVTRQ